MQIAQIETLPCQVVMSGTGLATITITLPEDQISGFVAVLTSLGSLFRNLGWKAKTNIDQIHAREADRIPERKEYLLKFEKFVCDSYIEFVKKGNSPRESLSLTASSVHYTYELSSYDIIKNILTKNKLLKKTGFYSEKATIFLKDKKTVC